MATTQDTAAPARTPVRALPGVLGAGIVMGSAEIVPGVSGGTVALVFGVYDRLIGAVRQGSRGLAALARGRPADALEALREVDWLFLAALLGGMAPAILLLTSVLERLLEEQPVLLSAAFFGLIVGSVVVASDEVPAPDSRELGIAGTSAVVTFLLLGLRPATVDDPGAVLLVVGGAIAICAMILPGISGSFLLLLLGLYEDVLGAVGDRDLVTLGLVAAGAVVGLASFSTLLHHLLQQHRRTVMASLLGLMVGSLRVLWPWPAEPDGVGTTTLGAPDGQVGASLALAVGAALAVLVVARVGRRVPVPKA